MSPNSTLRGGHKITVIKSYSRVGFSGDGQKIEWTPRAPSGTGYERNLYGEIEEKFFKPLDDNASKILNRLESESAVTPVKLDLGEKDHDRWAVFILGLIIRRPDKVEFIQVGFKDAGLDKSIARNEIPNIIQTDRQSRT